ncbi:MAG: M23 family metallopeptidase [Elusimicrobiota bacterium]
MYRKYLPVVGFLVLCGVFSITASSKPVVYDYARFSVLTPPGPDEPLPEVFKLPKLIHARHKIKKGENIRTIAKVYNADIRSLQSTNNNEFIYMSKGESMRIHNGKGLLYQVKTDRETLSSIVKRFKKSTADIKKLKEEIVRENEIPPSSLLTDYKFSRGDRIILPGIYVNLDTYSFPLNGRIRISSGYGLRFHPILKRVTFHKGCDIPMPYGAPVYPSRSGKVIFAGWINGYGYVVDIRHSDGSKTRYGHLSKILVKVGDTAQKGKTIVGKVGSSGLSTGPHLHFEIITPSGKSINPKLKFGKK